MHFWNQSREGSKGTRPPGTRTGGLAAAVRTRQGATWRRPISGPHHAGPHHLTTRARAGSAAWRWSSIMFFRARLGTRVSLPLWAPLASRCLPVASSRHSRQPLVPGGGGRQGVRGLSSCLLAWLCAHLSQRSGRGPSCTPCKQGRRTAPRRARPPHAAAWGAGAREAGSPPRQGPPVEPPRALSGARPLLLLLRGDRPVGHPLHLQAWQTAGEGSNQRHWPYNSPRDENRTHLVQHAAPRVFPEEPKKRPKKLWVWPGIKCIKSRKSLIQPSRINCSSKRGRAVCSSMYIACYGHHVPISPINSAHMAWTSARVKGNVSIPARKLLAPVQKRHGL